MTHVYMYGDKIVFSSSDGIYVFNEKTNEVTPLLCIKGVLAFVIDQSDQIWAIYNKKYSLYENRCARFNETIPIE